MAQELEDFNAKASNKDSLYTELKKMDAEAKKPADNSAEIYAQLVARQRERETVGVPQ